MSSATDLESFFSEYPLLEYDPGERIKRPMEQSLNLMYIKSGCVKIYSYSEAGEEITLAYLAEDHYKHLVVGYSEALSNYYVEALTKVSVWKAPKGDFSEFITHNVETAPFLLESLYQLVRKLFDQLECFKVGNAYTRIITFFLLLEKYFSHKKNSLVTIRFKLTHQMIADYTGLTRETVSLRIKRLKDKNIIVYDDAVLSILDVKLLKQEIEFAA